MYSRILVPIDGSATAAAGLREAIEIAAAMKSKLFALHVVNDLPPLIESASIENSADIHDRRMKAGDDLVAEAARAAADRGVACETLVFDAKSGTPAEAICREASARGCDLIVMGTHGRSGLKRLTMGSDAEGVLRHAPVPLLLVRHAGA
jgi:nucleotide-binding universal stress UspA family protein